jgi:putative ABC transport system permease protein
MFKTNLVIAFRNLRRNKMSSIVNIGGLTVGLSMALLIGLWIYDELSFNKYHDNYDRIGRVVIKGTDSKRGPFVSNSLPYPLVTELKNSYGQNFRHLVRTSWPQDYILAAGDKKLTRFGRFADEGFAELLTLKMQQGNRNGLQEPNSVLLSQSLVQALFGNEDAMGKVITISNKYSAIVTGVYEDLPQNTEFHDVKFISTFKLWESGNEWIAERATTDWMNHFLRVYAEIPAGMDLAIVNKNISAAELNSIRGIDKYREQFDRNPQVAIDPMSDWHLRPFDRQRGMTDPGPLRMVWLVSIIGMFVLLLACINFMNLSTARSEKRAREVGIRKTIGSVRVQLIRQFLTESFVVVIFSFVLACLIVSFSLPWFNQLAAKEMHMPWRDLYFWLICGGLIFITALLAGSYPAFYLSSFKPVKVLKGTFRAGKLAALPRKSLVVLQFTVSVALIICTIVVYRQVQFAKDRSVGYDREGLVMIDMKTADFYGKYDRFRTEFLNSGVVKDLSQSMGLVTEVVSGNNGFDWKGRDPGKDESFGTLAVTHEHGATIGWQFVAGRDFSRNNITDSSAVIINEAAARYMEFSNAVGQTISWKFRDKPEKYYTIIGVIKDAIMESPYKAVEPTLFFIDALNGGVSCMNIRLQPGVRLNDALTKLEAAFKKVVPTVPFEYKFADEEYALKFAAEERVANLAGLFGAFAIFISCLGLFGLASFTAEQRTREIGIRKVLGASVFTLWKLLSTEFLVLVIISFVLAAPVAWYFMNSWLQDYEYRTELSWWIFLGAGLAAVIITVITVSYHAIRAARINSVKSLKME